MSWWERSRTSVLQRRNSDVSRTRRMPEDVLAQRVTQRYAHAKLCSIDQ
jgi:hypothetical protein